MMSPRRRTAMVACCNSVRSLTSQSSGWLMRAADIWKANSILTVKPSVLISANAPNSMMAGIIVFSRPFAAVPSASGGNAGRENRRGRNQRFSACFASAAWICSVSRAVPRAAVSSKRPLISTTNSPAGRRGFVSTRRTIR
jgi:hypothetical protein